MDTSHSLDQHLHDLRAYVSMPDKDFWVFFKHREDDHKDENSQEQFEKPGLTSLFINDEAFAETYLRNHRNDKSEQTKKFFEVRELEKKLEDRILLFESPYRLSFEEIQAVAGVLVISEDEMLEKRYKRILAMCPDEFSFWVHHIFKNARYCSLWIELDGDVELIPDETELPGSEHHIEIDEFEDEPESEGVFDEEELDENLFSGFMESFRSPERQTAKTIRTPEQIRLKKLVDEKIIHFINNLQVGVKYAKTPNFIQKEVHEMGFRVETIISLFCRRKLSDLSTILKCLDFDPIFAEATKKVLGELKDYESALSGKVDGESLSKLLRPDGGLGYIEDRKS